MSAANWRLLGGGGGLNIFFGGPKCPPSCAPESFRNYRRPATLTLTRFNILNYECNAPGPQGTSVDFSKDSQENPSVLKTVWRRKS